MRDLTKKKNYRNKKITLSAEGEDCEFLLDGCKNDTSTVVWVHSDYLEDGKGRGIKAHDIIGLTACYHCHMVYSRVVPSDYSDDELRDLFHRGMKRSLLKLLYKGIIK